MQFIEVEDRVPAELIAEDIITAVKTKHPGMELRMLSTEEAAIIARCPSRGDYKRFRDMFLDPAKRSGALETLVYACTLHPPSEAVGAMLEKRPGLAETFGEKLASWAGLGQEAVEKKL